MLFVAALALAPVAFTPPQPWALGFAAPPRMPFVGDVDHDGYADLIVVFPEGDSIVDVNLTVEGVKSGFGFQAVPRWGGRCRAAGVGEIDDQPGADVVGLFEDGTLRLAGAFRNGKLTDTPDWARLPGKLESPALAVVRGGAEVVAFSSVTGEGYRIDAKTKAATACRVPKGTVWLGDAGTRWVTQDAQGVVSWVDPKSLKVVGRLGEAPSKSRPAAGPGIVAFGDRAWTRRGIVPLSPSKLPTADSVRGVGDFDRDGDLDVAEFRYGAEPHTANQVTLRRFIAQGEGDPDHDGVTSGEERERQTDPLDPDTDGDGLLDGWELRGYRGLDLPKLGCDPRHVDLVCLVSRFEGVKEETLRAGMARATKFYADLPTPNPDGTTGFRFHPVYLDPVRGDDTKRPWPENRDRLLPARWRGLAHWMQVTPGGGGQANELSDGGTCGEGALWAVFVHEFGHQLGLDHQGFWTSGWSPTYPSLMSYNYSYSLEDDLEKIRYSDGALRDYVLNEANLDETLPLPYEKVRFLERGPYRFRLKPNGATTLIDWNWNGVFGEKHVRADINYAYSTHAGRRDEVGKTQTSPWLFTHEGSAYVLYGVTDAKGDGKSDPTLSPGRTGRATMRRLKKPYEWEAPTTVVAEGLTGDPVAASSGRRIWLAYPSAAGTMLKPVDGEARALTSDPSVVPSLAVHQGRLLVLLWNPANGEIGVRAVAEDGNLRDLGKLDAASTNAPGAATDTKTGELIVALAQNQDARRPNRWQIRRYRVDFDRLDPTQLATSGKDWVEGEPGEARGTGRLTVLFDDGADAGPRGRIFVFGRGMTSPQTPWACTYVASQLGDRSVRDGWLVRRYYDEWTQSRSAPAAAWFGGDVIWAYRWVDGAQGPTDDNLHVGYAGLGIQTEPMGDHDDLTFLRTFGVRHSILALARVP